MAFCLNIYGPMNSFAFCIAPSQIAARSGWKETSTDSCLLRSSRVTYLMFTAIIIGMCLLTGVFRSVVNEPKRLKSLFGLVCMLLISFVVSKYPGRVSIRGECKTNFSDSQYTAPPRSYVCEAIFYSVSMEKLAFATTAFAV